MRRRAFLSGLGALSAAPSFAWAQPASKVFRIGYLGSEPVTPETDPIFGVFLVGRLRELGYVEGRNMVVKRHFSEGRDERFHVLARVTVFWNATSTVDVAGLKNLEAAARTLRVRLQPIDVSLNPKITQAVRRLSMDA